MGKYFGTDGFRGEANVRLTADHAYKIGRSFGAQLKEEKRARVVIGRDTRKSGQMLEAALAAGLTASGADVYLLGITTTPSVSYVIRRDGFSAGIMITASHNPYTDNGIKLLWGDGKKVAGKVEETIEAYLDGASGELPLAAGEVIGAIHDYIIGRNSYVKSLIDLTTVRLDKVRVGLDCANGSAYALAAPVFEALGAAVTVVANAPDGMNINRGCGSTQIENLQKLVVKQGLDLGFAYDGDADRCLAVDGRGRVVDGDLILYICGKYLKHTNALKHNTVVTTVMSNLGLYKALAREGIDYACTTVGDKYVYAEMCEHGYNLGGEQSGHIIFSDYATTGDGILTSLMVATVVIKTGKSLAELADEVTIYPQLLKNVRVADKKAVRENAAVAVAVEKAKAELGADGRLLVRESGTEPVIRVMAEAKTDADCEKQVDAVIRVMREEGLIVG